MPKPNPNLNTPIPYAGVIFPPHETRISQEMYFITKGGQWTRRDGGTAGLGNFEHYKKFMGLLWPDMDQHRWFLLMLEEYLNNILTCVIGPKDSSKTQSMAMIALADYYCFPYNTLGLVSSTDVRGLELRVYGAIKSLHTAAQARFPFLPGKLVDSKHALCTDDLDEDGVRDMRRGIICIPCVGSQGQFVGGLQKYVGIKQERRRLYADETQFMKASFMDSLANLNSRNFKGMFIGNPLGDGDPLDKLAEPKGGWSSIHEPDKTTVWNTRDIGGRCINLIGTDSPNFDYPQDEAPRFPYLINKQAMERVEARWGTNSFQYYSQCKGIRMTGMDAMRVLTRDLCLQFHAMEPLFWLNETRTKIYAVDAAYGNIGGDRCIGGYIEFGRDVTGKVMMRVDMPVTIPVKPVGLAGRTPEDQIAAYVREACEKEQIPPGNVFYDATGRGSLGTSFARLWSADVNPIEFGGSPSERPVTSEMMIKDHKTGEMRLMKANERFSKFVTELWWSVRYVIESGQLRGLPEDVMSEGCRRLWRLVKGNKIEIETKADMKERTGESPDLFDWLVTCVEGARRLGFEISRMSVNAPQTGKDRLMDTLRQEANRRAAARQLTYR